MKRLIVFLFGFLIQVPLYSQSHNEYLGPEAVAGGTDRALTVILVLGGLILAGIILILLLGSFYKIYYWFNPNANPENKSYYQPTNEEKKVVTSISKIDESKDSLQEEKESVKNYVDLGLSVFWADRNLFAKTPVDKGAKFSWGDKTKKLYFPYNGCSLNEKWSWDLKNILGNDDLSICGSQHYDAASYIWGDNWRLPQMHEIEELVKKCKWEKSSIDGISGYNITGPNGNSIFLPFTGEIIVNEEKSNNEGFYWTGIGSSDRNEAKFLFISMDKIIPSHDGIRWHGMAIRPVWATPKEATKEILRQLEYKDNSTSIDEDIELYKDYCKSFELTSSLESNDIMRDLRKRKMYSEDGKKLISTLNGTGGKEEKINLNPKEGTEIICDLAYDDYNNRFEKSIIIPNSVIAIGYKAFRFLNPRNITIPSSVKYITGNPFVKLFNTYPKVNCSTEYFKIIDGVLSSKNDELYVANLNSNKNIIEIPEGVKIIGRGAFNEHDEIELIKLPKSLIALSENSICYCNNLTVLLFTGIIKYFESSSINNCGNLKKIYVPKGYLMHYQKLFPENMHKLINEFDELDQKNEEILTKTLLKTDLENKVANHLNNSNSYEATREDLNFIENIKNDYQLSKISPEELENKDIDWGVDVSKIHDEYDRGEAWYSMDGKKFLEYEYKLEKYKIRDGVEIICDNSFCNECGDKEIILPESVKVIGDFIFWESYLGNFTIPSSVKKITGNPFVSCEINLICKSKEFCIENGVLYDKDKTIIISVLYDLDLLLNNSTLTFPQSVRAIGRHAFSGISCGKVIIPSNVIFIGEKAFYSTTISEIKFNDNLIEIENKAFNHSYFKKIDLPDSVLKIGISAFEYCENLEYVKLSSSLEIIDENTFYHCDNLKQIYIPEGLKIIKKKAFAFCKTLTEIHLPNSLEKIEEDAFMYCGFKTIVVPENTIIEEGAFRGEITILRR